MLCVYSRVVEGYRDVSAICIHWVHCLIQFVRDTRLQVVFQDILKYQKALVLADVKEDTETARAKFKHERLLG